MKKDKTKKRLMKRRFLFWIAALFLGTLCLFSAKWYIDTYGDVGFDAIIFSLMSNVSGTEASLMWSFILRAALPAVLLAILIWIFFFYRSERSLYVNFFHKYKVKVYPFSNFLSRTFTVITTIVLVSYALLSCGLYGYIVATANESSLYEKKYVDPNSVSIEFPEQKQNLIYIFSESMETTFFSKEQGGVFDESRIPELYKLAEDNINFSNDDGIGGGRPTYGTTWTAGGMVAQSSGTPLKLPVSIDGRPFATTKSFLPGVTSLANILHDNGYYQALMVGSDANYGHRADYYTQHGVDKVFDLATAPKDGIIEEGYHVWWGFEDKYLFEYAKQELPKIASQGQPFSFTMLTEDTHFPNGYVCDKCDDKFPTQYDNVYACSSKQITEFVEWVKTQDFYKNTTIIINGDHCSMDEQYAQDNIPKDHTRRVYNCIINSRTEAKNNKNREFTTLDMFPTTLAAMGCKIEGDRLGLGTNLFSGKKTLCEQYGFDEFSYEVSKTSEYYTKKILHEYKD